MNAINKNDSKSLQYAAALALNHRKIKKHSERITKIKPFIDKNHWERINYPLKKMIGKKLKKIIQQFLLMP